MFDKFDPNPVRDHGLGSAGSDHSADSIVSVGVGGACGSGVGLGVSQGSAALPMGLREFCLLLWVLGRFARVRGQEDADDIAVAVDFWRCEGTAAYSVTFWEMKAST